MPPYSLCHIRPYVLYRRACHKLLSNLSSLILLDFCIKDLSTSKEDFPILVYIKVGCLISFLLKNRS